MINEIYRQSEDCLLEDMGGEILLYLPTTAEAIQLNQSSQIVWQLCDGEHTVGEIIDELRQAFPNQADQIKEDVIIVIKALSEKQALELTH